MNEKTKSNKLIILGAGGHSKSLIDSIEQQGIYEIAGVVDNEATGEFYRGYNIIGTDDDLENLYHSGIQNAIVGVGTLGNVNIDKASTRQKIYDVLKLIGFCLPVIVDPASILAKDVEFGEGTFVGKGAIVNSNVKIGCMTIVNSAAVIEHDCIVGDFSHISVKSTICGGVTIEKNVMVGAGAVVIQGIHIENNVIIGAGSVVTKDIKAGTKVVGVPAKER